MQIIGISGKIHTGKTVLTQHLLNLLGPDWQQVNFAGLLKSEVAELFKFPPDLCYSKTGKNTLINTGTDVTSATPKSVMSVRELLQWWGTDVRRRQDPDCWVKAMADRLTGLPATGVIIDDIRFPNEADFVRGRQGMLVRLEPYDGWDHANTHESETALDEYNMWGLKAAPSYGGLEPLAREIIKMLQEVQR